MRFLGFKLILSWNETLGELVKGYNYILHAEGTLIIGSQRAHCGRHVQKWLNVLCLLIVMPVYKPSPCVWAGSSDLPLTNRIHQKWWAITLRLGFKGLWLLYSLSLACSAEVNSPVESYPPYGKELVNSNKNPSPSNDYVNKLGTNLFSQLSSEVTAALVDISIATL